jgi:hypothetical protein
MQDECTIDALLNPKPQNTATQHTTTQQHAGHCNMINSPPAATACCHRRHLTQVPQLRHRQQRVAARARGVGSACS